MSPMPPEVVFESASSEPAMLVSGVTSGDEMCIVAENGGSDQRGALLTAEACEEAVAAGDGRELFVMTESGQLKSAVGGLCAILAGNSAAGGGTVELDDCEAVRPSRGGRGSVLRLLSHFAERAAGRFGWLPCAGCRDWRRALVLGADAAGPAEHGRRLVLHGAGWRCGLRRRPDAVVGLVRFVDGRRFARGREDRGW